MRFLFARTRLEVTGIEADVGVSVQTMQLGPVNVHLLVNSVFVEEYAMTMSPTANLRCDFGIRGE